MTTTVHSQSEAPSPVTLRRALGTELVHGAVSVA